jgi:hypothetical protein
MRLVSLGLAVSLSTSGCAYLAVPPAAGAALGATIGIARHSGNEQVSVTNHTVVGGLVGVAVDVLIIGVIALVVANSPLYGEN